MDLKNKQVSALKKQKKVSKNVLANPFTLDWPSIKKQCSLDIIHHLKEALSVYVAAYEIKQNIKYAAKAEKRKKQNEIIGKNLFVKQDLTSNDGNGLENKSTEGEKKSVSDKEQLNATENVIFGFNACMRAIEKDNLSAVLVNGTANPPFLVQTFLPLCSLKSIPIIPVKDLPALITNIGIKSCLVMGLKKNVVLKKNRFHKLYIRCCKALDIEPLKNISSINSSDHDTEDQSFELDKKTNINNEILPARLTSEQIRKHLLIRSGTLGRIFHPNEQKRHEAADFLSFGAGNIPLKTSKDISKPKFQTKKQNSSEFIKVDTNSLFIDLGGADTSEEQIPEYRSNLKSPNRKPKIKKASISRPLMIDSTPALSFEIDTSCDTSKKGKRKLNEDYVLTTSKKIKNNPDRRKMKKTKNKD